MNITDRWKTILILSKELTVLGKKRNYMTVIVLQGNVFLAACLCHSHNICMDIRGVHRVIFKQLLRGQVPPVQVYLLV